MQTSSNTTMRTKDQTHMPIKINSSGVIPVIFASSVLAAPRTVVSFMELAMLLNGSIQSLIIKNQLDSSYIS